MGPPRTARAAAAVRRRRRPSHSTTTYPMGTPRRTRSGRARETNGRHPLVASGGTAEPWVDRTVGEGIARRRSDRRGGKPDVGSPLAEVVVVVVEVSLQQQTTTATAPPPRPTLPQPPPQLFAIQIYIARAHASSFSCTEYMLFTVICFSSVSKKITGTYCTVQYVPVSIIFAMTSL